MILTIFKTNDINKKYPESPFNDKTFIFNNISVSSNFQAFQILVNNFTLNLSTNIKEPLRIQRLKKNLNLITNEEQDYILFDFECDSEFNKNQVIEYFKNIKCIIGESRSYNGVNNFNLKGFIRTQKMSLKDLRVLQAKIQSELESFGYFNEDCLRVTYFTAPILKSRIIINNEEGIELSKIDNRVIDFIKKPEKINLNIASTDTLDICLEVFKNLGFKMLDKRVDSAILFEKDDEGDYIWYPENPYIMFHHNRLKCINIWDIVKSKEKDNFDIKDFIPYKGYHLKNSFLDDKGELDNIVENFLFKKNGILTLKSYMGSGKTKFIEKIIDKALDRDFKILIITNRITLAQDFKNKFKNFKIYLDDQNYTTKLKEIQKKSITKKEFDEFKSHLDKNLKKKQYKVGDCLICQYNSLFYYDISKFDLVIMDEFMSLVSHSRSLFNANICNLDRFFDALNKRLVIADAFLCDFILKLLPPKNITNIIYDKLDETNLFEAPNRETFLAVIYSALKNGKKISVSSTSPSFINELKCLCNSLGISPLMLVEQTTNEWKEKINEIISKDQEPPYKAFIFSPVLTVGVSNLNKIDYHFHFDSSKSADVISSLQMMKRSRKSKNIVYYVEEGVKYTCVNYELLREQTLKGILSGEISRDLHSIEYNSYYQEVFTEKGKIFLKFDLFLNMLERNHKKSFKELLKVNFKNKPKILKKIKFDFNLLKS